MLKLNYEHLLKFLKTQEFDAQLQTETNQLYTPLKVGDREFPFFARIFEESGLLQLLVFLPCSVTADKVGDMGRLLHMFNKELDVPGFGMDELIGVVFFRCMVPTFKNEVQEQVVESYLATFKTVCHSFSPAVEALAAGAITFDQMLEKAAAAQKEAEANQQIIKP